MWQAPSRFFSATERQALRGPSSRSTPAPRPNAPERQCRSETNGAALDAVVKCLVEPDEYAAFTVVEIDDVGAGGRIVAFADEGILPVVGGGGQVKFAPDASGQRMRVVG